MKTIRYILLSLAACSVLLVSCVKETQINSGEGVDVSILIATGGGSAATRADGDPSGIDSDISHFRVLIFDSKSGLLAHKFAFEPPATPQEINMKTGVYDFVLIANDNVDETGAFANLNALTIGSSQISALNDISFASSFFDETTNIPMVLVVRGVKVYPEGRIELPTSDDQDEGIFSPQDKTWYVSLKRLAVRVDLKIKLSAGQTVDASKKLLIDKVPTRVYLLSDENNEGYEEEPRKYEVPSAVGGELIWKRIILPESMFSDASNADNGVTISLTVNDVTRSAVIGVDLNPANDSDPKNYTLPRNTYLDITGEVSGPATENIQLYIEASSWENREVNGDILNRTLNVSALEKILLDNNRERIYFSSNQQSVWLDGTGKDSSGADVPLVQFISHGTSEDIYYDFNDVTGIGTGHINLVRRPDATNGVYRIYLNAGGLRREITLMVAETEPIKVINAYVGTFHRWNQTGERVIRIGDQSYQTEVGGKWTAMVIAGKDWIRLGDGGSDDDAIYDVVPGDAEDFQVAGNATSVSGDYTSMSTPILFRVGLKSKLASEYSAPRYGLILLFYNDNTKCHKIYVRQGEAADYLMRKEDLGGTGASWGTPKPRPLAAKYSPYNLTAEAFLTPVTDESISVSVQGGKEVAYPTQAGAFWHFSPIDLNNTTTAVPYIYAMSPVNPISSAPFGFTTSYDASFWGDYSTLNNYSTKKLSELYETCPVGYRRPSDGSTAGPTGSITPFDSEVGQSLFLNPPSGRTPLTGDDLNAVLGYYADGFFDRRTITNQSAIAGGATNGSAVSTDNSNVAYRGQLFYNPNNNASLFFPMSGRRDDVGRLSYTGVQCHFWSSSSLNKYISWLLWINDDQTYRENLSRFYGYSIRCVADE